MLFRSFHIMQRAILQISFITVSRSNRGGERPVAAAVKYAVIVVQRDLFRQNGLALLGKQHGNGGSRTDHTADLGIAHHLRITGRFHIAIFLKGKRFIAGKLRIDSALGLNEFYTDRNGQEELVSAKRNEGGFVHTCDVLTDDEKKRNTFECDMVITNCRRIEADDEKGTPEKMIIKGAIFDFRKALLPVEFTALNPKAMDYFEDLGATGDKPVFTKVWGRQVSEVIVKQLVEESAFGEAQVKDVRNTRRDFVITGAAANTYDWDDESTMTAAELAKAVSEREVYLAGLKQRQEEYKASKGAAPAVAANPATAGFNF